MSRCDPTGRGQTILNAGPKVLPVTGGFILPAFLAGPAVELPHAGVVG